MKITVVGAGYVGLSNALLLSQNNEVTILEINNDRVKKINQRISPILEPRMQAFIENPQNTILATSDPINAFQDAEFIIIATPTNYDVQVNYFDTSTVKQVISDACGTNPNATIVIKSTIPVGFTEALNNPQVIFSPEFLREGHSLEDNLAPSRIIVGERSERAKLFAELLAEGAEKPNVPILLTGSREAEAIKLFANTYLAMRVAYFNELDTFAQAHCLTTKQIIDGIGLDPRIGTHYNNPSFGYGGYCLPKDTKQLLANYADVPQNLISAIVDSNATRSQYIADQVLNRSPSIVGIHRLAMKFGSDNFRESSVINVLNRLKTRNIEIIIYEPQLAQDAFLGCKIEPDETKFIQKSDVILANRITSKLNQSPEKLISFDIYHEN